MCLVENAQRMSYTLSQMYSTPYFFKSGHLTYQDASLIRTTYQDTLILPKCVRATPYIFNPSLTVGGHLTILMDETTLDVNIGALDQKVLSSIDVIRRLRHYITSVSSVDTHCNVSN